MSAIDLPRGLVRDPFAAPVSREAWDRIEREVARLARLNDWSGPDAAVMERQVRERIAREVGR